MTTDIESLFSRTLIGQYDDDEPWQAVHELRQTGSRDVFTKAKEWCSSEDPLKRARGVDVLAQLGRTRDNPQTMFREESYDVISGLLEKETKILPLSSEICALGFLEILAGIPWLIRFSNHTNPNIRFSVAHALGSFANDSRATETLLVLMHDRDDDVRDWATFGIGSLSTIDSDEIRDALVARLNDSCEDTQAEAIVGLAGRKDVRVLPQLVAALKRKPPNVLPINAAKVLLGCDSNSSELAPTEYIEALKQRFLL